MLNQFSFANYKSFKDEAFLDLMADKIKDHESSLIVDPLDKEKFLPVIVIYGPNGGGKSTVLEALAYLRELIVYPIFISQLRKKEESDNSLVSSVDLFKKKHFKFDTRYANIPTCFDILFRNNETQFKYQLSLINNKIVDENLYAQSLLTQQVDLVFERSIEKETNVCEELKGFKFEKVNRSMPLLSHISNNYDIKIIDKAIAWFLNMNIVDYDDPAKDREIMIPKLEKEKKLMFEILNKMDVSISDIRVEVDSDGKIKNVHTIHTMENGDKFELLFEEESSGTRKLFSCISVIIDCLEKGEILIADELDAKLHPKFLKFIIELFKDSDINKKGAQLLLTSHDITTMTPELFRRDEIWFCAKNPDDASTLYSLISFKKENGVNPRKDELFGKQYLEGRYGADPYIRKILDWGQFDEQ